MSGNPHTSVRSRQVAAELRAIREQAGLSGADVAKLMGMSPSKISRIETGVSGLQIEDVAALLGLYRCRPPPAMNCSTWFAAPRNAAGGPANPGYPSCGVV